jgi:preprotein translocase subunit SecG
MSTRAFLVIVIVVAALLATGVYMHRPRGRASFPIHGDR